MEEAIMFLLYNVENTRLSSSFVSSKSPKDWDALSGNIM